MPASSLPAVDPSNGEAGGFVFVGRGIEWFLSPRFGKEADVRRSLPIRRPAMVMGVLVLAVMVANMLPASAQTAVTASEVSVGSPSGQTPRNRMRVPSGSRAA